MSETIGITHASEINDNDFITIVKDEKIMLAEASLLPKPSTMLTGMVVPYASETAPDGYLFCDGSEVSRTEYADLYAVIGTRFGDGNGTTTFNIPDLRGMFVRGWDNGAGNDPDAASRVSSGSNGAAGDVVGSKQEDELKEHQHVVPWGHQREYEYPWGHYGSNQVGDGDKLDSDNEWPNTSPVGGAETRPANIAMAYIIKA
ncbi:tail fiber protein [Planctomycetota bacterium]|nr:tail fiber protein [Planctomycetota bacterium]